MKCVLHNGDMEANEKNHKNHKIQNKNKSIKGMIHLRHLKELVLMGFISVLSSLFIKVRILYMNAQWNR